MGVDHGTLPYRLSDERAELPRGKGGSRAALSPFHSSVSGATAEQCGLDRFDRVGSTFT